MRKAIINIIDNIIFTISCMIILVMACVLGAYTGSFVVYITMSGTGLCALFVQAMVEEGVLQ